MLVKSATGAVRGSITKAQPIVMTDEQEQHLRRVREEFCKLVDLKYRAGQQKHGGDLHHNSARQLLDSAVDEAVDQVVYLLTLREVLSS